VTCWPESVMWASLERLSPGQRVLVLSLDPVSLAVSVPSFPGGDEALTRFCREVARAVRRLAVEFDPTPPSGFVANPDPGQGETPGGGS
jgi:hypothetical protein